MVEEEDRAPRVSQGTQSHAALGILAHVKPLRGHRKGVLTCYDPIKHDQNGSTLEASLHQLTLLSIFAIIATLGTCISRFSEEIWASKEDALATIDMSKLMNRI